MEEKELTPEQIEAEYQKYISEGEEFAQEYTVQPWDINYE